VTSLRVLKKLKETGYYY